MIVFICKVIRYGYQFLCSLLIKWNFSWDHWSFSWLFISFSFPIVIFIIHNNAITSFSTIYNWIPSYRTIMYNLFLCLLLITALEREKSRCSVRTLLALIIDCKNLWIRRMFSWISHMSSNCMKGFINVCSRWFLWCTFLACLMLLTRFCQVKRKRLCHFVDRLILLWDVDKRICLFMKM